MKIIIEENDSFINDGEATMIVVAVTKDDGKSVRFPYSASKTFSDLISDVNAKIGSAPVAERPVSEGLKKMGEGYVNGLRTLIDNDVIKALAGESDGKIKKEDLVKCVKLLPRDKDAPIDMAVGGIYRVLALPTNKVPYFEIIDDTDFHKAEIPRRVPAFPEEIEFFQKRKPPTPKEIGKFEEIFPCPICHVKIVCNRMDDNKYHGKCGECNHEIVSDTVRQTVNT